MCVCVSFLFMQKADTHTHTETRKLEKSQPIHQFNFPIDWYMVEYDGAIKIYIKIFFLF